MHHLTSKLLRINTVVPLSRQGVLAAKSQDYSTRLCYKPDSVEGKEHVTDGNGKHTASWEAFCSNNDCPIKRCLTPCNEVLYMVNNGHYTHYPPKDTDAVFIDQADFNNNKTPSGQSFVRSPLNDQPILSQDQMKTLTEDDLTPNKAADAYSVAKGLSDKI